MAGTKSVDAENAKNGKDEGERMKEQQEAGAAY